MLLGKPSKFGDIIVADHLACFKKDHGVGGTNFALEVMDSYPGWTDASAIVVKSSESVERDFREFCSSLDKVSDFWSDNPVELILATEEHGCTHHLATDSRPQSNCAAERTMWRIFKGTRAVLWKASTTAFGNSDELLLRTAQLL